MRSSVGSLLSHGPGEPIMSHPDYSQHAHHHGSLLVLVRGIGGNKPRSLQKVFERIQRVENVQINSNGQTRDIWIRYLREHPVENNDWGDFQTHRRLLGLITVGKFDSQIELNELCRVHESLKVKYNSTLFDSRCILFGPTEDKLGEILSEEDPMSEIDCGSNQLKNGMKWKLEDRFSTPSNFKSPALFYQENDSCSNLETTITEFIGSLFWILESKRLERSKEKIDKVVLLLAPFEKKDFVGLDLESRNNRKRCMGRATKHLGDLTFQAGLIPESLTLYHTASETLRAISDSLWLGAANEGLCTASAVILYPNIRHTLSLQRNASLQEGSPQKNKNNHENLTKHVLSKKSGLVINLHNDTIVSDSASSSTISSAQSSASPVSSSGSSSSSSFIDPGTIKKDFQTHPVNVLPPEEITTRYRDAIINYSKYRHAGIIETESALKAARICIEQNQNLDVAMFLQNVLYINLNMSEQERVQRFETLTDLYQRIGYNRKAAFCQRLAAWRHIAQSNTNPDWGQSYRLMLESFAGHKLSLDPIEVLINNSGWPCLQIDLVQQLVVASRRLGHSALATRHMTFLLQTMWKHLSSSEQREMSLQLQSLSAQCEGAPVPLVLENGIVIPPANLTDIPFCSQLQIKEVQSHLRPHKVIEAKIDHGPFLFTPIHFNSLERKTCKTDESKITFQWVQNDMCEVTLKLTNYLPFELKVSDMRLLTNGIVFESLPQTIVLTPEIPTFVTLHGIPLEVGELEVLGFSTHTLGIKSNCRLKNMIDRKFPPFYKINVIPALPKITVTTSLPQTATFSGMSNGDCVLTSASLTLFNGESADCIVTITNNSNVPVEFIEGTFISAGLDVNSQNRIFQWSPDDLNAKLPIKPNTSVDFTVRIFGDADFLGPISTGAAITSASSLNPHDASNSLTGNSMLSVSGHTSIPSRVSSPTNTHRRNELTSSFRSSHSGHSSLATFSLGAGTTNRQIEAQLRMKYAGGDGFTEGFCRQCSICFNMEFLPSAQITNWDVLPAEIPSQFYLVLDVINLTAQEMTLNYTANKNILIEAKESCRVPVPVVRCPLDKILADRELGQLNPYIEGQVSLSIPTGHEIDFNTCSEHIADQVNLKWTLAGTETEGIASLKGISLSPTMLDLVTIAPLEWEVFIDNVSVQPQSEVTCNIGQCVTLGISICNLSLAALQQLTLLIQFYQDYQNGIHNYRLETRVTMTGPNQIVIPNLNRNEKIFHQCSVIFFTPGRFKADIQCRSLNSTVPQHSILNNSENHVWRFIPPVEITVIE